MTAANAYPPTLRAELRRGTAQVHEALHSHPWFAELAEGRLSAATYQALMQRLFGFYRAFDPMMCAAAETLGDRVGEYRYVPRAQMLRRAAGATAPDRRVALPRIGGLAAFCGAAYVVDGAVLGGAILGRALPRNADRTYWDWCSREGPGIWRANHQLLRDAETDASRQDAMSSALATFAAFAAWVDPAPDEVAA